MMPWADSMKLGKETKDPARIGPQCFTKPLIVHLQKKHSKGRYGISNIYGKKRRNA